MLVQRVRSASVDVAGETVGAIEGRGICVLLGITHDDTREQIEKGATKVARLRIFPDDDGRMNRDVLEIGGGVLVVSQFTLYGDTRKGRRPSFVEAASSEVAIPLYEHFTACLRARGLTVATGRFGADMQVHLNNDGPVTLMIET